MNVCVYLVGSGPGDPGLITVRAADLLAGADVVVHDYLAGSAFADRVKPRAEVIYVGKKGFTAHVTQPEINALLVRKARELEARGGGSLVRLKGGDPFVFGRGGEEALALRAAGVPFEVVPGITSGIAAPAYAGIPVTHRGLASTLTFVTGHEDPSKEVSAIDWPALARLAGAGGTLCFYMGMRNLPLIAKRLMESGLDARMPAAVVQWGTSAAQRAVTAPLWEIPSRAAAAGLGAPAIILVGQVASLRDELSWFEKRPLFGRRIVVTRSRAQAGGLSARLAELGAQVVEFPTIAFAEPDDGFEALDAAIGRLAEYAWVVFTSVNGVDAFFDRLERSAAVGRVPSGDARALAGTRVAAIGPATAARLAGHGIQADAVPAEYRGEAAFEAIAGASAAAGVSLAGARVLVSRAQEAREALPALLRAAGAQVDVAPAYKTVAPEGSAVGELKEMLAARTVDAVTFTSSSTARNLLSALGDDRPLLGRARLFSIGPVTSATLADAGFPPYAQAAEYTIPGLVNVLVGAYGGRE